MNSDDADAMVELVDTVQYGLDACVNYVTSYTDTSLDFNEMQQEAKSILNKVIARLKKRVLSRSERKSMKIYANKTHLKSEVSWLRSLFDKAKEKVGDLKKWLPKIMKALNIVLDSLQKIFPQLDIVKEYKDHIYNAADLDSIKSDETGEDPHAGHMSPGIDEKEKVLKQLQDEFDLKEYKASIDSAKAEYDNVHMHTLYSEFIEYALGDYDIEFYKGIEGLAFIRE